MGVQRGAGQEKKVTAEAVNQSLCIVGFVLPGVDMKTKVVKHIRSVCTICNVDVVEGDAGRFIASGIQTYRGVPQIHLSQACNRCSDAAIAISEADELGLRYSRVGCGTDEYDSYEGCRCPCGCVTHASLGWCVQCWKAYRMLTRVEAEARFNNRLLKQLKEFSKNGNRNQNHRAIA